MFRYSHLAVLLSMLPIGGCAIEVLSWRIGCPNDSPQYESENIPAGSIYSGKNPYFYGRFCGPHHPNIDAPNLDEKISILKTIEAVDVLDNMCKNHDICYASMTYFNTKCDNTLSQEINSYNFKSTVCKKYALVLDKIISHVHSISFNGDCSNITGTIILPDFSVSLINNVEKPEAGECI